MNIQLDPALQNWSFKVATLYAVWSFNTKSFNLVQSAERS